jgi:hypothetical protein
VVWFYVRKRGSTSNGFLLISLMISFSLSRKRGLDAVVAEIANV